MRLFCCEFLKLIYRRPIQILLIVIFLVNGFLFLRECSVTDQYYKQDQYQCAVKEMKEYPIEEAYALLEQYQEELGQYHLHYSDNLYEEEMLLRVIREDMKGQMEYTDYLNSVMENVQKITAISIFGTDSFSYKNAMLTEQDFSALPGRIQNAEKYEASGGIEKLVHFRGTDLLLCLFIFVIVSQLVMVEKEEKQLILIKSTKKGRTTVGMAKIGVGAAGIGLTACILYGTNLLLSGLFLDLGRWNRSIQMVSDFISCPYAISVGIYLLCQFLLKWMVFLSFFSIAMLFACLSQSIVGYYIRVFLIFGIEIVLSYSIRRTSWLANLRDVNLVSFLQTEDIIGKYYNLNLFGIPVRQIVIVLVCCGILLIGCMVAMLRIYDKRSMITVRMAEGTRGLWRAVNWVRYKLESNVHITRHELYKILIQQKIVFLLIGFLLLEYISYKPMYVTIGDVNEWYYKQYMDYLEGEMTQEKEQYLKEQNQYYETLTEEYIEYLASPEQITPAGIQYYEDELVMYPALQRVNSKVDYLKSQGKGELFYDTGYLLLLGQKDGGEYRDRFLLLLCVMIFSIVPIYAVEKSCGMNYLLSSTKHGRVRLLRVKRCLAVLLMLFFLLILLCPYIWNILHTYGITSINAPVCSMEEYASIPSWISIAGFFSLQAAGVLILCRVLAQVILWTARRCRTYLESYLYCMAYILMPYVVLMYLIMK